MAKTIVCHREDCARYKLPMIPVDELPGHVLYLCPFEGGAKPRGCGAARVIDKVICGGTRGAGRTRTDGRHEAMGRGFGDGPKR